MTVKEVLEMYKGQYSEVKIRMANDITFCYEINIEKHKNKNTEAMGISNDSLAYFEAKDYMLISGSDYLDFYMLV